MQPSGDGKTPGMCFLCPELTSDKRDRPAHSVSPQSASAANGYDNVTAATFEGMCDDDFVPAPAATNIALQVRNPFG